MIFLSNTIYFLFSIREVMPSHFKVKEYCPLVFRALREYWKLHDASFRVRRKYSRFFDELRVSFFRIHWPNRPFLWMKQQNQIWPCINPTIVDLYWNASLKRMSNKFITFFHSIIEWENWCFYRPCFSSILIFIQYIVESQGDTLLPHFYAMYRLTVDDKENYVLVMRNVLSTKYKIHVKYDVKVSENLWFENEKSQSNCISGFYSRSNSNWKRKIKSVPNIER